MTTIPELITILQELFDTKAETQAKATGFIKRQRKWTGGTFAKTLVFGWMQNPDASLSELQQAAIANDCPVSVKTISTRLAQPQTTRFMRALLEQALEYCVSKPADSETSPFPFPQIILLDSTQILLPDEHQSEWPGGGNWAKKRTAMKIQAAYDWYHGSLDISLHPAIKNDAGLPLPRLQPGSLVIQDAGYFGVERCLNYEAQNLFWLTRFPSNRIITTQMGQTLPLVDFLAQFNDVEWIDEQVFITKAAYPMRLIAQRVPDHVARTRQSRLIAETKRRSSRTPTPQALAVCQWTFIATNVPTRRLSPQQAFALYRSRWQIELLFKFWKQDNALGRWRTNNPQRILTEIYAKLLMLLLQHWFLVTAVWHTLGRSLVLAGRLIRQHASQLLVAWYQSCDLGRVLDKLHASLAVCRISKRHQRPALFQLIEHYFP